MAQTHIAIMRGDYLDKILSGAKTIESRFSQNRCAPFGVVSSGDQILFKKAGGFVIAKATVKKALFFENLTPERLSAIERQFRDALQITQAFLQSRMAARYASLIFLANVEKLTPYKIEKKDRRGWVVLQPAQKQMALGLPSEVPTSRLPSTLRQRHRIKPYSRANSECLTVVPMTDVIRAAKLLRSNAWRNGWWNAPLDERVT